MFRISSFGYCSPAITILQLHTANSYMQGRARKSIDVLIPDVLILLEHLDKIIKYIPSLACTYLEVNTGCYITYKERRKESSLQAVNKECE